MPEVFAVVMAGGAGTRFWPASRAHQPKQLLALGADPSESLLRATVRRLGPMIPPERIVVVTAARLVEATKRELPDVPPDQILAEPAARNTAPCIAWAADTIRRKHPDALLAVLPSDHYIENEPAFLECIGQALAGAERGFLTTIGIVPTRPDTGYGYIEVGEKDGSIERVVRFVEKPDLPKAKEYLDGGRHLWNAGMFFFTAKAILEAIEAHMPELAKGTRALGDRLASGDLGALAEIFPTLPSKSIDHGVMEHAKNLAVVRGDFGWNDVGSWESAWALAARDERGNAKPEDCVLVDANDNLVRVLGESGKGKTVALVGVEGLVVVDTPDALLVMPRERAQDVRRVVDALKSAGRTDRV